MTDIEDAVDLILEQWAHERPDLDCSPMGMSASMPSRSSVASTRCSPSSAP